MISAGSWLSCGLCFWQLTTGRTLPLRPRSTLYICGIALALPNKDPWANSPPVGADHAGPQAAEEAAQGWPGRVLYGERHLIENFFAKIKQFRAIATRYEKTARNFLAAVHLVASVVWLN